MARFLAYDIRWPGKPSDQEPKVDHVIVTLPGWEGETVDEEAIFQKIHDDFGYGPLGFSALFIDDSDTNPSS